jgi:branched-chain amino acid transport system permease protein
MLDYLVLTLTIVAINSIVVAALNLQLGYSGMVNLMAITCVGIGGYTALTFMLAPATQGIGTYIGGLNMPLPVAVLAGTVAAGLFGLVAGGIALRRLRAHYFAIVTFCIAEMVHQFVTNYSPLFNGATGLFGLNPPYQNDFPGNSYRYFWLMLAIVSAALVYGFIELLRRRPFGRVLRALREDRDAAQAFGKNVYALQLKAFVIGSAIAGLSGALLVSFIGALDPTGWTSAESLILFTALFLGGAGNNFGVIIGTLLVAGLIGQGVTYIPHWVLPATAVAPAQVMIYGIALIVILRFRPEGILPERPGRDVAPLGSGIRPTLR